MPKKSAQKKPAKPKKTSREKFSKRSSTIVSTVGDMEAKEKQFGALKMFTAHKSFCSSRH